MIVIGGWPNAGGVRFHSPADPELVSSVHEFCESDFRWNKCSTKLLPSKQSSERREATSGKKFGAR